MLNEAVDSVPAPVISPSARMPILHSLARIAAEQVAAQMDGFITRLAEALLKISTETVRTDEAAISLAAFQHLKSHELQFRDALVHRLNELHAEAITALGQAQPRDREHGNAGEFSLVSFDEMENKVLIGNLSQAVEARGVELLGALNVRIARILQRDELSAAQNPFRAEIFLQASHEAWCRSGAADASHGIVLRQLRPDVFLEMTPILQALNQSLIGRGILPSLTSSYSSRSMQRKPAPVEDRRRGQPLYQKLQNWLSGGTRSKGDSGAGQGEQNVPGTGQRRNFSDPVNVVLNPVLLDYLGNLQRQERKPSASNAQPVESDATILRQIKEHAPAGTFAAADENAIELLAKIFDFVLREPSIAPEIRVMIARLQIPLLKAVLLDRAFFFRQAHPARRLIETMAKSSAAWDQQQGREDPLYKIIEQTVERVQQEFEDQLGLFSDVVAELESFIEQEEMAADPALAEPVAEALRAEKTQQARERAEADIAARIETGEVAGFVEVFLDTQWVRVLTLAHSVADSKPEALANACKTMDDLIWSLRPKNNADDRKSLLRKLPALLSMLNSWLNALKWDGEGRVQFFSSLAQRHAAIVRAPLERSARIQVEMAVNAAQKAIDRRFDRRAREMEKMPVDQFGHLANTISRGQWVEFTRNNGAAVKFKLAWVSPQRSRFIFTSRTGGNAFSYTPDELADALRNQTAQIMPITSVVDRALAVALDDIDVG